MLVLKQEGVGGSETSTTEATRPSHMGCSRTSDESSDDEAEELSESESDTSIRSGTSSLSSLRVAVSPRG